MSNVNATQGINKVLVQGTIDSIEVRDGVGQNGGYKAGKVIVDIGNDMKLPIDFFVGEKKKDGQPNSLYKGMVTFLDTAQTIAENGRENAHAVNITTANLQENIWSPDGTNLITGFRISNNIFRRGTKEIDPSATIQLSGIVLQKTDEVKTTNEATGRVLLSLGVVGYNNRFDVFELIVEKEEGVAFVKQQVQVGNFLTISGHINYKEEVFVETPDEGVGFGGPIENVRTKVTREIIMDSSTMPAAESPYTKEQIDNLLQTRETLKAAALQRGAEATKQSTQTAQSAANFQL